MKENDNKDTINVSDSNSWHSYDWVRVKNELENALPPRETFLEKSKRKFKENPLVPLGFLTTAGFLVNGIYHMALNNKKKQNLMMRGRVAAQGATFAIFVAALYYDVNFTKYFNKEDK